MKRAFKKLFQIRLSSDFFPRDKKFEALSLEPTQNAIRNFTRYKLIFRNSFSGGYVIYEANEESGEPKNKIKTETVFSFKIKINDSSFFLYNDVVGWSGSKIFYKKNAGYDQPVNVVINGALTDPDTVGLRAARFRKIILIDDDPSFIEVRDEDGGLKKTIAVRKKTPAEVAANKPVFEEIPVDLSSFPDGRYDITTVKTSGSETEKIYVSPENFTNSLMILHIVFRNENLTINDPSILFTLNFKSKAIPWWYEVNVSKDRTPQFTTSQMNNLTINDTSIPKKFTVANPVVDIPNRKITFKSDNPLALNNQPMNLQLLKTSGGDTLIDKLPNPTFNNFILINNQLIAKMIINI